MRQVSVGQPLAPEDQLCPFPLRAGDVFEVAVQLLLIHGRPHVDARHQPIPNFERLGFGDEFLEKG